MIPRHQQILFWILLVSSVAMSVMLIRMRERAHDRLLETGETMPLNPPAQAVAQNITFMIAKDADGSLTAERQKMDLPADTNARARVILQRLIALYARPDSTHPIAANDGVSEVFFMPLPPAPGMAGHSEMAIVNLSGSFVGAHPSGIETETLTLLSLIGTLRANFPQVTQVRFLVDGEPRDTLAGHADLTRVYLAADSENVDLMTAARFKIGVFDSGFGGLTVLRALLRLAPAADFAYMGDTARLPYGSKSRETIARYALSSTRFLVDRGADFLVIACNTASALALEEIRRSTALPVLGVIETGVCEARASSGTGDILVIATEATVGSHAYAAASRKRGLRALEKACPLLAPLVEEGWVDHPVTAEVVRIYLSELLEQAREAELNPDTLVLGCTHYPLLRATIEAAIPARLHVIDSAEATAVQAARMLQKDGLLKNAAEDTPGECRFFATDSASKFQRLGARFLGRPIDRVELVDLGG